jgi:hypothetical protein
MPHLQRTRRAKLDLIAAAARIILQIFGRAKACRIDRQAIQNGLFMSSDKLSILMPEESLDPAIVTRKTRFHEMQRWTKQQNADVRRL